MKFFTMYADYAEEYEMPGSGLDVLIKGCMDSELQFLPNEPLEVEIDENGGTESVDFLIYRGVVPLVSDAFYQVLVRIVDNDNLFCRPVMLTSSWRGRKNIYHLALPPRIACLDLKQSKVVTEEGEYVQPFERERIAEKIVINPARVGRYKIFKLAGVSNQEIIVTEEVEKAVKAAKLKNIYFGENVLCSGMGE